MLSGFSTIVVTMKDEVSPCLLLTRESCLQNSPIRPPQHLKPTTMQYTQPAQQYVYQSTVIAESEFASQSFVND